MAHWLENKKDEFVKRGIAFQFVSDFSSLLFFPFLYNIPQGFFRIT